MPCGCWSPWQKLGYVVVHGERSLTNSFMFSFSGVSAWVCGCVRRSPFFFRRLQWSQNLPLFFRPMFSDSIPRSFSITSIFSLAVGRMNPGEFHRRCRWSSNGVSVQPFFFRSWFPPVRVECDPRSPMPPTRVPTDTREDFILQSTATGFPQETRLGGCFQGQPYRYYCP